MLETLIAFALVTMVLAVFYRTTGGTLVNANQSLGEYQRTELARSVLDEFVVLQDPLKEGQYENRWDWKITTSIITDLPETSYTKLIAVERVTAVVSEVTNSEQKTVLYTERIVRR